MKNINETLTQLNPDLLSSLKGFLYSIFKIDVNSESFTKLIEKHSEIKNASYVINSNTNCGNGSIFIDSKGNTLFVADFFVNLLDKVDLDFEIESPNLIKNHPLEEVLSLDFNF